MSTEHQQSTTIADDEKDKLHDKAPPPWRRRWLAIFAVICCLLSLVVIVLATTLTQRNGDDGDSPVENNSQGCTGGACPPPLLPASDTTENRPIAPPPAILPPTFPSWKINKEYQLQVPIQETAAGVLEFEGDLYMVVSSNYMEASGDQTLLWNYNTTKWTSVQPVPYPGNHQAAVVYENQLYLFGGMKTYGDRLNMTKPEPSGKVQIGRLGRNATTGELSMDWRLGTSIPFDGGSGNVAEINGKMLYCGGNFNDVTTDLCALYTPSPEGGTWEMRSSMPGGGRHHAAHCAYDGKFYVFGGRSGLDNSAVYGETHRYDPETDTWTTTIVDDSDSLAPMPVPRGGFGTALCMNGKAFMFGGELPAFQIGITEANPEIGLTNKGVFVRQDIYDFASNSWSRGSNMPAACHGMYPVVIDGVAHFAGGASEVSYGPSKTFMTYQLPQE